MFYKLSLFGFCFFCVSLFGVENVYLKAPDISPENIIGANVGIRPHRKSGVRIEAERLQDKLIIHNYGYGSYGLTLCFGGANEVVEILKLEEPCLKGLEQSSQFLDFETHLHGLASGLADVQKESSKTIAVLGAGVVGLATAYDLLEKGYEVHLYAEDWSPNLTSNVGAGCWTLPALSEIPFEKKSLYQRMSEISEQRFLRSTGDCPEFMGVKLICSYSFNKEHLNTHDEVLVHFDNGAKKKARRIYRTGLDGKVFMEDLFSKVKSKGAVLHQKRFENLEALLNLKEAIIINCMSMGSRGLFDDQEFIPVRGQIIYLKPQKEIDYTLFQSFPGSNCFFHMYPWSDRIILGGVYEKGEEELTINPEILDKIIQNAKKCLSGEL